VITIRVLMRAIGPITHGSRTAGNEQVIRREPVATPLGVRQVPVLSGNSLRHRMFREPLADHIVATYGLAGSMTKEEVRWLYNGGAMGKDHGTHLGRVAEALRLYPMLSLLGGSLPDTIVAGSLSLGHAWLVCRETEPVLRAMTPGDWWADDALSPASCFVGHEHYYRHDAARTKRHLTASEPDDVEMMPHGGEMVCAGSCWLTTAMIDTADAVAIGAALHGLQEWVRCGATVGGQSSRGHGRMQVWCDTGGVDTDSHVAAYRDHVESLREEATAFLRALYTKPKKQKELV